MSSPRRDVLYLAFPVSRAWSEVERREDEAHRRLASVTSAASAGSQVGSPHHHTRHAAYAAIRMEMEVSHLSV